MGVSDSLAAVRVSPCLFREDLRMHVPNSPRVSGAPYASPSTDTKSVCNKRGPLRDGGSIQTPCCIVLLYEDTSSLWSPGLVCRACHDASA